MTQPIAEYELILEWLRVNAPVTASRVRPPIQVDHILTAPTTVPRSFEDLYAVANGADAFTADGQFLGTVLPAAYLYSLDESVEERSRALEARGNPEFSWAQASNSGFPIRETLEMNAKTIGVGY